MNEENKIYLKENFNINVDELTTKELRKKLKNIMERKNEIIKLKSTTLHLLEEELNKLN